MFSLKNKVFIVTGAGSGMGRELTLQLISKGAKVAACDINEATLKETRSMIADPELIETYVLDVTDKEKVKAFPSIVKSHFNRLNGVINNAGIIQPFVKFTQLQDSAVKRVFDINLFGLLDMTRAVLENLDKTQDGFIVNISSMGGFLPVPGQGIYGASKAAVKLFTEALYAELKDTNVHVSVVFPGAIETNIASNSMAGLNEKPLDNGASSKHKTTPADEAARIIIEGIEKGKLKIYAGSDSKMMQRIYRLMPIKSIDIMAKKISKML